MASQLSIDLPFSLPKSSYTYGKRSSGEIHGVVLTKEHVVNMILDITGYRQTEVLKDKTFLEPSCGHGAFLIPAINRFFLSLGEVQLEIDALKDRFRAYDIDEDHVNITRKKVRKVLVANNVHLKDAEALAETWVLCGDFLLQNKNRSFDFIIGNPPYIRIEQLSTTLQAEYRSRYASLFDRADIYVAFIEHGLDLLSQDGKLSFICADRWILNKYGAPLKKKLQTNLVCNITSTFMRLHPLNLMLSLILQYLQLKKISPKKSLLLRCRMQRLKNARRSLLLSFFRRSTIIALICMNTPHGFAVPSHGY